jgi:hypothetical protein
VGETPALRSTTQKRKCRQSLSDKILERAFRAGKPCSGEHEDHGMRHQDEKGGEPGEVDEGAAWSRIFSCCAGRYPEHHDRGQQV